MKSTTFKLNTLTTQNRNIRTGCSNPLKSRYPTALLFGPSSNFWKTLKNRKLIGHTVSKFRSWQSPSYSVPKMVASLKLTCNNRNMGIVAVDFCLTFSTGSMVFNFILPSLLADQYQVSRPLKWICPSQWLTKSKSRIKITVMELIPSKKNSYYANCWPS